MLVQVALGDIAGFVLSRHTSDEGLDLLVELDSSLQSVDGVLVGFHESLFDFFIEQLALTPLPLLERGLKEEVLVDEEFILLRVVVAIYICPYKDQELRKEEEVVQDEKGRILPQK